jgi:hypothetical protein
MPHQNSHIQFGKDLFSNSIYSSKIYLIIYNFFYLITIPVPPAGSVHDYIDMVPLQALVKTSALEVIRILKVMSSDPNNTTSSVSGRRKNKPAIWLALALHKLMSADHGYSTR